eukprot:2662987-Pyramimonas_sp.AAC.1
MRKRMHHLSPLARALPLPHPARGPSQLETRETLPLFSRFAARLLLNIDRGVAMAGLREASGAVAPE